MSNWTDEEAARLAERWRGTPPNPKSLPGACPKCGHPDAFQNILVYPYSPETEGFNRTIGPELIEYPTEWLVTCSSPSCGRSGMVPIC
jgi:hypothetical protein